MPERRSLYELAVGVNREIHEDTIWCIYVPQFIDYKVAPAGEALKFAFEANPSLLYKMNNGELPFGCHAWERYETAFWQPFIKFE